MDHPTPTSRLVGTEHCTHLRHKGMYVTSVADPCELEHCGGAYDATAYWCTATQRGLGPDGQPVNGDACRAGAGRSCCEG